MREDQFVLAFVARGVGIPAKKSRTGKFLLHHFFKAFGAQAQLADLGAAAFRAFFGDLAGVITHVADQALPRPVMYQGLIIPWAA